MDLNFTELGDVVFRALSSLVTLFLITKLLGKKQISQLSLFDYVIGISIGNFAAEMTINTDIPFLNGTVAVVVFGLVAYLISYITLKNVRTRKFFTGKPTVLIEKGKLLINSMQQLKFDMDDLLQECRSNGYFDISQIEYAVMEANGKISFLPKSEYRPTVLKDLNLKEPKAGLCANIIIDGDLMDRAMKLMNIDDKWVMHELKVKGKKLENVLLATLDNNGKFLVYEKNVNKVAGDILE